MPISQNDNVKPRKDIPLGVVIRFMPRPQPCHRGGHLDQQRELRPNPIGRRFLPTFRNGAQR